MSIVVHGRSLDTYTLDTGLESMSKKSKWCLSELVNPNKLE
jgi:hypothetical protein